MKEMKKSGYETLIETMVEDPRLKRMDQFIQHGNVTTLDHVKSVARMSLAVNERLGLNGDPRVLVRGGLLHDYYLYDWHHYDGGRFHGFTHPAAALKQAEQDFDLSDREKNVIRSHMWPLTLLHVPDCREAWIVSLSDKLV